MKVSSEILAFVKDRIAEAIRRPQFYAPNPIALEQWLICLEMVRSFVEDSRDARMVYVGSRYADLLTHKGYGVALFTGRRYDTLSIDDSDSEVMNDLGAFWREYYSWIGVTIPETSEE